MKVHAVKMNCIRSMKIKAMIRLAVWEIELRATPATTEPVIRGVIEAAAGVAKMKITLKIKIEAEAEIKDVLGLIKANLI